MLRAQTGPKRKSSRQHDCNGGNGKCDEEKTCTPFFYAKPTVERPLMTCCSFCCALVFFLVVLVGMLFGGIEVIRFSSDVPFYLYDHVSYKREVALLSAFDVADARLDGELNERENAIDDFRLRVIYELDDADTLLSAEVLDGIKEMEEKIVAVAEYTTFCALNYDFNTNNPVCVRQDSVVNYFDPSWWMPTTTPPPEPTVPSKFNAELALNQSKLASPDQDNYYAFANPQDTVDGDAIDLSQDNIDAVIQYWSGYCSEVTGCPAAANGDASPYALTVDGVNVTIASPISELMDTNFGIQDNGEVISSAQAMMSVFYFGSPQRKSSGELYDTDTDGLVDMKNELGEFLLDEIVDILEDGVQGVKVFWGGEGNGMLDIYVNSVLLSDSSLLIFAVLFIVVYLIISLRSWWLGIVGMLMILGNFGPALIVYRIISGYNYFGTLNALSVFLVLGIGADDIFVFTNTWKHVRRTEPDLPIVEQLRHALYRGGKAMFVTSVTTSLSFLMNAISDFPAVQSFGIFSAVLIMCNFLSVITLYPAATMVYEYYFNDSTPKKNRCLATCSCCKKENGYNSTEGAAPEGGVLVRFFENKFYPFIHKFRIGVLSVFAAVLVFYVYMGSQLEPESESVSLLPDDDQYTIVRDKIDDYFSHSDISGRLTVQIPFGLVRSDRGDCGGDKCDPTIETDYGAPVWGDIDGISNEYTQKWFLDFCDAIETAEDAFNARRVYEADEVVATPVKCPIEGFRTWCQQQDGVCEQTHPTLSTEEYVIDADLFHETFLTFLRDEVPVASDTVLEGRQTNLDIWEETVRFERTSTDSDVDPTLRYITVEVLLSEGFGLEFGDGITLYSDWDSFVETWVAKASTSEYEGADATVGDAFVTDNGGFQWFHLQRAIIQEAFTGIGLSLLGALVIVCLATSNWIISTLAIFVIAALVGGVVMFTVANGWDLGILEAVLFVMVVGFSVDYTLHLSDSYLESTKKTRGDRTRDMLITMGPSVLSGAISTIGAAFPLLFAVFVFFLKFGTVIFFIIAQSLVFSLFLFATLLDMFGPEEPVWGQNIKKGSQVLVSEASGDGALHVEDENTHLRAGKVTAVDADAQMCTVIFEDDNANGHETSAGCEQTVVLGSVRRRYQAGHIPAIDAGFTALGRFVTKCCGCISCCFTTSREDSEVLHGPKVVAGEDV